MSPAGVNLASPSDPVEPEPVQVVLSDSAVEAVGDGRYAPIDHTHDYADLQNKPVTLAELEVETEVDEKIASNKIAPSVCLILEGVAFADREASPVFGTLQAFTDADSDAWSHVISGGGVYPVLGFFNGINWTVAAI